MNRSVTPINERDPPQQQHDNNQSTHRYHLSRDRLGPGIVLHARSASPPLSRSFTSPQQASSNNSSSTHTRSTPSYTDSPLIVNYLDDLLVERIMNTMEKQDHLLIQSMSKGISLSEYKYELMLKLCGKK